MKGPDNMDTHNEVKVFLTDLKNDCNSLAKNFAMQYDIEVCEAIIKIINNIPLSAKELDIIKKQACTKYFSSNELIKLPQTPDNIKNQIVENIINNKMENLDNYDLIQLLNNIFKYYPNISSLHLNRLCKEHFEHSLFRMSTYTPTVTNPSPYCNKVVNTFSTIYLDALNDKTCKPVGFNKNLSPLRLVSDPILHQHITDRIPQSPELSEFVATQLINNPTVDENLKNQLFDTYGYNYSSGNASYATPYIMEKLYNSAIDTLENSFGHTINSSQAMADSFLKNAIMTNTLPESIQIDFVNRIILSEKEKGSKKANNFLSLFNVHTDSPKVLHIIFEQAPHINDRDGACANIHISKEDLQKQANIYCNKIQRMLTKKTPEKILDKWVDEINDILKSISLKDEQYHLLLNSSCSPLLYLLISNSNTPPEIVFKATEIIEQKFKEKQTFVWKKLMFNAKLHTELLKQNCCSQKNLDYVLSLYQKTYMSYAVNNNVNVLMNNSLICENNVLYKQILKSFKNIFETTEKNFFNEIDKYLLNQIQKNHVIEHLLTDDLDKTNVEVLEYRLRKNINNFTQELGNDNAFSTIKEHAHRHILCAEAISEHLKENIKKEDVIEYET